MSFFSVVIPLYNKENFIGATVKSILAQNFTDFELLIVDDCSTDGSLIAVSGFNDDRISIIRHEKNKGLSASRNTGIKNAVSGYICFLDADDLWQPGYLDKIYTLISKFPEANLFATNYEERYNNGRTILPVSSLKMEGNEGIVADFFEANLHQPLYSSGCPCAAKSVFETVGGYDENVAYGEDIDFNIRANRVFKLAYSKEPLVIVNVFSENQITNSALGTKTIVDLDKYESLSENNPSLKKYLDVNRYILARLYRLENNTKKSTEILHSIHPENINFRQKILLRLPLFLLKAVKSVKLFLVKAGWRFTSFG